MTTQNFKNNKGFMLIAAYMLITVLIILAIGFSSKSIHEQRFAQRERDSVQAFWLAEAGMDSVIPSLPDTGPFSGKFENIGHYYTKVERIKEASQADPTSVFLITSKGRTPDDDDDYANIDTIISKIDNDEDGDRKTTATIECAFTTAVTADNVTLRGNAEVNGDIEETIPADFETVFGVTKAVMESNATNSYTDPANNITPVNNITWVVGDLQITSAGWTGSGILVVNGDLIFTGGTFRGIIWVTEELSVRGNTTIDGAFYVEGDADVFTGTPDVSFDTGAMADAFDNVATDFSYPFIINWKEE
ncbi:hypothetical protein ACFL28_02900 [Candidatus Omnitrophota bacterium]